MIVHRAFALVGAVGQASAHVLAGQGKNVEEELWIGVTQAGDGILTCVVRIVKDCADYFFGLTKAESDNFLNRVNLFFKKVPY